jgi:hypothetical protein
MGKGMILLGAGASHGSLGCSPRPPPLGDKLYAILRKKFKKSWGIIPDEYQNVFRIHFEDGMGGLAQEARNEKKWNLAALNKDMAIYFSRFRIGQPSLNLYCKLMKRYPEPLRNRQLVLGTINYDCLLDYAIFNEDQKIAYLDEHEGILLYKIHGSCHFIPDQSKVRCRHYSNTGGEFNSGIIIAPLNENVEKWIRKSKVDPAMRLFTKGKDILSCRDMLERILQQFENMVNDSDFLVIIGVKPNPEDNHIWDLLADMKGDIVLCGRDPLCKSWLKDNRGNDGDVWIPYFFEEGYEKIIGKIDAFLNG